MARRIESHFVQGPAGKLESLLEEPEDGAPVAAALVCHPHPLFGGTMHNKVVYRIAKGLRQSGHVVLRFNFRGVNLSEGLHDEGRGEVDDARSALKFLRERYPSLPFTLAGFSFGSRVALRLGCTLPEPKPERLIAVGFPTRMGPLELCALPKYFVQSTHDEFGPKPVLELAFQAFPEPKHLTFIDASDHFFADALPRLEQTIASIARGILSPASALET